MPRISPEIREVQAPIIHALQRVGFAYVKSPHQWEAAELLLRSGAPGVFWRQNVGARNDGKTRFGVAGMSDLFGVLRSGRVFALECKRIGNKPTSAQSAYLRTIAATGGIAAVVHGVEEAFNALDIRYK